MSEADPTASDAFCILPWMHLEVLPGGASKPCCVSQDVVRGEVGLLNVARIPIDGIRASAGMRELREDLAAGRKVKSCSFCWGQEERGEGSGRQQWNANFAEAVRELSERTRRGIDATAPLPLQYLQVGLGNTCNLACRMCNSAYSSRIAEDPVHAKWAPLTDHGGFQRDGPPASGAEELRPGWLHGVPWFEQKAFLQEELLGHSGSLQLLYVTGGEPLMNESFERTLEEYARAGDARKLRIIVNTNLFHNEARLQRILGILARFGNCMIGASVDGHGAVYEYVRHPARWDILERNLRLVRAFGREHGRVDLMLNAVVQPYNCLQLVDLLRFADELDVECYPHVIDSPWYLKMQVVPRELRLLAARRIQEYATSPAEGRCGSTNRGHALRLARHLETIEDDATTAAERRGFASFTRELDAARRQSIEATVPELARTMGVAALVR